MTGRIISLYTGALGLDRPFHWHGFETVATCDSSAYCRHIIGYYLPRIPIYGSDEDVTSDRLRHDGIDPTAIAGVIGGPPCQPSSHAGKRLGVADPRWRWPQAVRVVGDIRPHWCVFEQPAGLVSLVMPDGERPFLAILAALAALGYRVGYDRWPARAVGAPHPRMRVALIGLRDDVADAIRDQREQVGDPSWVRTNRVVAGWAQGAGQPSASDRGTVADADGGGRGTPVLDHAARQCDVERRGRRAVRHAGGELVNRPGQHSTGDMAQAAVEADSRRQRGLLRSVARPGHGGCGSAVAVGVGQANANGARSPEHPQRSGESGAEQTTAVGDSRGVGLANSPRGGRTPRRTQSAGQQGRPHADERGASGDMANADGRDASTWSRRDSLARDITPGSIGGASVADAQSALGRITDGLSRGLAHLWPAGRGQQQYSWEPPRLVTRPPRGSTASLIAEAELEAMGNSVVSQQFEPVAAAMADIERMFAEVMV